VRSQIVEQLADGRIAWRQGQQALGVFHRRRPIAGVAAERGAGDEQIAIRGQPPERPVDRRQRLARLAGRVQPNGMRRCGRKPRPRGWTRTSGSTTWSASPARVGRETVQCVSNIYKYYVAYSLMRQEMQDKAAAEQTVK